MATRKQFTCEVYPDSARQWRWRLKAPNGKIVADGSEGYKRRSGALKAAKRLVESTQLMRIVETENGDSMQQVGAHPCCDT